MFHTPAHKDTAHPPGQTRNPVPANASEDQRQASWDRYQDSRNQQPPKDAK